MNMNPNNHPNRSWRARMRHACAAWMAVWLWPVDGSIGVMDLERLQDLMQKSYRAGYETGRASMQRGQLATNAPTAQEITS